MESSLLVMRFFILIVTLSLQVLGKSQATSPATTHHFFEKRGLCLIPNRRKGCLMGIKSCCRACCAEYYRGYRGEAWAQDCGCRVVVVTHPTPAAVVVTPAPVVVSPSPAPVAVVAAPQQPVYYSTPAQPVYYTPATAHPVYVTRN